MLCCSFAHLSVLPQPLYGLLQAKLQLITHAYFEEKDFSQISILKVRMGVEVPFFFIVFTDEPSALRRSCTST